MWKTCHRIGLTDSELMRESALGQRIQRGGRPLCAELDATRKSDFMIHELHLQKASTNLKLRFLGFLFMMPLSKKRHSASS